jgi:cell fate regulator YaaT (PSP1 superfamily)
MTIVVGVRFKDSGKTYHFDPRDIPLAVGDWAIVETVRGPELGRIAAPPMEMLPDQLLGELKPVLRRATQTDIDNLAHYQQYLDEALAICAEKVAEHKLPMVLVKAEYNFDGSRLTFFFTADKRVDFRTLVRDLARTFHTRIELRQVGPRDEAKLLGGIGPCGRLLCCSTFLPDFARVSIKMAKDQDLPLNPVKISGVCGRLLCCLSYEHEQYLDIKAELPSRGSWVRTPEGPGEVIAVNVVRETVTVELGNGNTIDCTAAQIAEVTQHVATEARARNAAGITPVARGLTSSDMLFDVDVDALEGLEDRTPPSPVRSTKLEAALIPALERNSPRTPAHHQPSPQEGRPPVRSEHHTPVREQSLDRQTPPANPSPQVEAPEQGRPRSEQTSAREEPATPEGTHEQWEGQRARNRRRRRNRGGEGK